TGVANGVNTFDAVNVGQLNGAIAGMTSAIAGLQGEVDELFDMRREDRKDMKQGIAAAVAIANAPMPSEPGRVSYTLNGSAFRGELGVGGAMNYRLNTEAPMAIGVGVSHAGGKNTAVRVGVSGEF
ncbi:MAG TPA: hypothetical protein VM760_02015, partial [Sphingomicrobium sp.]|nr:hypothetical protein [Sphingomicrobium sp.]